MTKNNKTGAFSLLELALSLSLVIGLLAVTIFAFTGTKQDNLNEAAIRLQTLITYTSAQASNIGKTIKLNFDESAQFLVERDALTFPNVFTKENNEFVESLNGLAEVFGDCLIFYADGSRTTGTITLRSLNQDDTRKYLLIVKEYNLVHYFTEN